jgi:hypothetical protein
MNRFASLVASMLLVLTASLLPAQTYNTKVYLRQGGDALVVSPSGVVEWLPAAGDTKVTTGFLGGGGTDANPLISSSAGMNFLDFRSRSTDATGADSRGLYWRHYAAGVNSSSDCFRPYLIVTASGANAARGIHASVAFTGTGNCTGEVSASKGTLEIPPALKGTACAVCANLYMTPTGTVAGNASGLRFVLDGDSTAVTAANTNAAVGVLSVDGVTITSNGLVHTSASTNSSHGMRILVNGAPYEILMKAL